MNKKIKGIINNIKENKKLQIGIATGLGVVLLATVAGTIVYVNSNRDNTADKGNIEASVDDKDKELILSTDDKGNLVIVDEEGNIVAEGEEVENVVSSGTEVVMKSEDGTTTKVDKVEGNTASTGGQVVKPPTTSGSKPSTGTGNDQANNGGSSSNDNNSNSGNDNSNSNNNGSGNNNNNGGGSTGGTVPPKPEPTPPPTPPTEEVKPERTWKYDEAMSRETFNLMNKFRQENGVAALSWSDSEHTRAKSQAEKNASKGDGGHTFNQISLITSRATAQSFINIWSNSSGHKQNMLDEVNIAGAVAVYKDSDGVYYVVASFDDGW